MSGKSSKKYWSPKVCKGTGDINWFEGPGRCNKLLKTYRINAPLTSCENNFKWIMYDQARKICDWNSNGYFNAKVRLHKAG